MSLNTRRPSSWAQGLGEGYANQRAALTPTAVSTTLPVQTKSRGNPTRSKDPIERWRFDASGKALPAYKAGTLAMVPATAPLMMRGGATTHVGRIRKTSKPVQVRVVKPAVEVQGVTYRACEIGFVGPSGGLGPTTYYVEPRFLTPVTAAPGKATSKAAQKMATSYVGLLVAPIDTSKGSSEAWKRFYAGEVARAFGNSTHGRIVESVAKGAKATHAGAPKHPMPNDAFIVKLLDGDKKGALIRVGQASGFYRVASPALAKRYRSPFGSWSLGTEIGKLLKEIGFDTVKSSWHGLVRMCRGLTDGAKVADENGRIYRFLKRYVGSRKAFALATLTALRDSVKHLITEAVKQKSGSVTERASGALKDVLRWPYAENDRAQAERHTEGLVKLVLGKGGRIIGAGVVGLAAGEMSRWIRFQYMPSGDMQNSSEGPTQEK